MPAQEERKRERKEGREGGERKRCKSSLPFLLSQIRLKIHCIVYIVKCDKQPYTIGYKT